MRTYTTGELITASIGNVHWRDNFLETYPAKVTTAGDVAYATNANAIARLAIGNAYYGGLHPNSGATAPAWTNDVRIINFQTAEVTVSNTTTETTLFTYSVPGNILSTGNAILVQAYISGLHNNGTVTGPLWTVKYGGTAICLGTAPGSLGGSATRYVGVLSAIIKGSGATNTQAGEMIYEFYRGSGTTPFVSTGVESTAAIDSTSAQTLLVTVTQGNASANVTCLGKTLMVMAIPAVTV